MSPANHTVPDTGFLPDFCARGKVLTVIVSAQLLAVVLALYAATRPDDLLRHLSGISLFIQWAALLAAAMLCALRRLLGLVGDTLAGVLAWLLIQLLVAILCELGILFLGELLPALDSSWFLLRALGISAIVGAVILRYMYVQHRWRQQVAAEAHARLLAMQARIRPHFLFNSMNTLADLVRSSPERAEQAVLDLADLYRACLIDLNADHTLQQEIDLALRYLRIEQLRLGERLTLQLDLELLPGDSRLPALILQPLVENAVYHGIEPNPRPGKLTLRGTREQTAGRELACVRITNTLPQHPHRRSQGGHQLAQENIRQRLHAFFDGAARLDVTQADGLYQVEIRFPI